MTGPPGAQSCTDLISLLGLLTQYLQWLVLLGSSFVISVYLQQERGPNAIQTGPMLLPATIGLLLAPALAQRMAGRHSHRRLVRAGRLDRRPAGSPPCCSPAPPRWGRRPDHAPGPVHPLGCTGPATGPADQSCTDFISLPCTTIAQMTSTSKVMRTIDQTG